MKKSISVMLSAVMLSCCTPASVNADTSEVTSWKFDFGANTAAGYIGVDSKKQYYSDGYSVENVYDGMTYGFLGTNEGSYRMTNQIDGFVMDEGVQVSLFDGGSANTESAYADNVGAYDTIAPGVTDYNMGDAHMPVRFAVKVPAQSYYHVKAVLGCADASKSAKVTLFSERRRPIVTDKQIGAGQTCEVEFNVAVMNQYYKNDGAEYTDDMLNIVAVGENAGLAALEITQLASVTQGGDAATRTTLKDGVTEEALTPTIWMCTDSTGCDQKSFTPFYPLQNFEGVGGYIHKYLKTYSVSNQGEGGLASNDSMHLSRAVKQWKPGDYLYVEYGHNESSTKDDAGNVITTAAEKYKENLQKYYDAAHTDGVKLIIVAPIDRCNSNCWSDNQWKSSLSSIRDAGKAFVEEKIDGGATDIAFIDLNTPWVEFLNKVTNDVADKRVSLGLDTAKTLNKNAVGYYFTWNKLGNKDLTHINDFGADQAAYMFFEQAKNTVESTSTDNYTTVQKAVLKGIVEDMRTPAQPCTVGDDVIKAGYAPNSLYPDKYTLAISYKYPTSIQNITMNENGTLKSADVRVLSNLAQYATVYVTAYDANNNVLGEIAAADHVDNTSEKPGDVKTLVFDSAIVPHHFEARVYYCDANNKKWTGEGETDPVSAVYSSRNIKRTLFSEDFSDGAADETLIGVNKWNTFAKAYSFNKRTNNGVSFGEFSKTDSSNAWGIYRQLDDAVSSGKVELRCRLRWRSGNVRIQASSTTGTLTSSYTKVNLFEIKDGVVTAADGSTTILTGENTTTINKGEWLDYDCLIDLDEKTAALTISGYDTVTKSFAGVSNLPDKFATFAIGAKTENQNDCDIADISVRTVDEKLNPGRAWTSDFNGTAANQKLNTIFGETTAVGKTGATADAAGLTGCVASATSTTTKVGKNVQGIYSVKMESSAASENYAFAVYNTTAQLTSDKFSLNANDEFTMSYITYACSASNGQKTTVKLKNGDTELISYTYDAKSGNVTDVKIGGAVPDGFAKFSAVSLTSASTPTSLGALSNSTINNEKNTNISLSVKGNGEASISFKRGADVDKTFTGKVGEQITAVTAFEIASQADDASRMCAIDDLKASLKEGEATEPTPSPTIIEADKYEFTPDPTLAKSDAIGFTKEITVEESVVNSLTWYLRKNEGAWTELTTLNGTEIGSGTTIKVGLIVYDLPENTNPEEIKAGYSCGYNQ